MKKKSVICGREFDAGGTHVTRNAALNVRNSTRGITTTASTSCWKISEQGGAMKKKWRQKERRQTNEFENRPQL